MVAAKSAFFAALLAVRAVVAATPACLIGAINTADEPSDVRAICRRREMRSTILDLCGNNAQAALGVFSATCEQVGEQVPSDTSSSAKPTKTTGPKTAKGGHDTTMLTVATTEPATTKVFTTTGYDSACDCTTTMEMSTTIPATTVVPTLASGSGSGEGSGSGSAATSTAAASAAATSGAASNVRAGSWAALVFAAGVGMVV